MRSPESVDAEIDSLWVNVRQLATRTRTAEKQLDTFVLTAWWKRLLFAIDGWPLARIVARPRWRPWRRWWTS